MDPANTFNTLKSCVSQVAKWAHDHERHPAFEKVQGVTMILKHVENLLGPIQNHADRVDWVLLRAIAKQTLSVRHLLEEWFEALNSKRFLGFFSSSSRVLRKLMSATQRCYECLLIADRVRVDNVPAFLIPNVAELFQRIFTNAESMTIWTRFFGNAQKETSTSNMLATLAQCFGLEDPSLVPVFRKILDANGDEVVSVFDFACFSNQLGPRESLAAALEDAGMPVPISLFNPTLVRDIRYPDGRFLHGELIDGKLNGRGFFTYEDGRTYLGGYKDRLRHGQGVYMRTHEGVIVEKYEGEWKDGQRNGLGKLTLCPLEKDLSASENLFVIRDCEWLNDQITGRGSFVMLNGNTYEGEVIAGASRNSFIMHGHGVFEWVESRKRYEGQFQNGKPHGFGIMSWGDGRRYEGDWKDGKVCGRGEMRMPNGRVQRGEYVDNQAHGVTLTIWPDGVEYEGEYTFGRRNGRGEYRFPDGSRIYGQFFESVLGSVSDSGSLTGADSTSSSKDASGSTTVKYGTCEIILQDGSKFSGPYSVTTSFRTLTLGDGRVVVPVERAGPPSQFGFGGPVGTNGFVGEQTSAPDSITGREVLSSRDMVSLQDFPGTPPASWNGGGTMNSSSLTGLPIRGSAEKLVRPSPAPALSSSKEDLRRSLTQSAQKVHRWLERANLEIYWPNFESAGYDDLDVVTTLTEEEIRKDLNIDKPGHVKKLLMEVERLKNETQAAPIS